MTGTRKNKTGKEGWYFGPTNGKGIDKEVLFLITVAYSSSRSGSFTRIPITQIVFDRIQVIIIYSVHLSGVCARGICPLG